MAEEEEKTGPAVVEEFQILSGQNPVNGTGRAVVDPRNNEVGTCLRFFPVKEAESGLPGKRKGALQIGMILMIPRDRELAVAGTEGGERLVEPFKAVHLSVQEVAGRDHEVGLRLSHHVDDPLQLVLAHDQPEVDVGNLGYPDNHTLRYLFTCYDHPLEADVASLERGYKPPQPGKPRRQPQRRPEKGSPPNENGHPRRNATR